MYTIISDYNCENKIIFCDYRTYKMSYIPSTFTCGNTYISFTYSACVHLNTHFTVV